MNSERKWVRVTKCKNIPLREGRAVRFGKLEIAIFNLGDRFLAVENRCPHQGGPLSDGILNGNSVVCPLHAWKIDLEGGTVKRPADIPKCVQTFATSVEDGMVLIEVPAADVVVTYSEEHLAAFSAQEHSRFHQEELSS